MRKLELAELLFSSCDRSDRVGFNLPSDMYRIRLRLRPAVTFGLATSLQ